MGYPRIGFVIAAMAIFTWRETARHTEQVVQFTRLLGASYKVVLLVSILILRVHFKSPFTDHSLVTSFPVLFFSGL